MAYYRLIISFFVLSLGQSVFASSNSLRHPFLCLCDLCTGGPIDHNPNRASSAATTVPAPVVAVPASTVAVAVAVPHAAATGTVPARAVPVAVVPATIFTPTAAVAVPARAVPPAATTGWKAKFELLKIYVQVYGHANVPTRFNEPEYPGLGKWVANQRAAYENEDRVAKGEQLPHKANRISSDRVDQLNGLGFVWKIKRKKTIHASSNNHPIKRRKLDTWEISFKLLETYVQEYGNARINTRLNTPKYPRLGKWVSNQRVAYNNEERLARGEQLPKKAHRISSERIDRLNRIGFVWD